MEKPEWKAGWVQLLSEYPWQIFASLTFRPGLSKAQALGRLERWLGDLKVAEGGPHFGFYWVREFGKTGQDLHFHALIAGLTDASASVRVEWMKRWQKVSGDGRLDTYIPDGHGIEYLLKDARPDDPDGYGFDLSDCVRMQTEMEPK